MTTAPRGAWHVNRAYVDQFLTSSHDIDNAFAFLLLSSPIQHVTGAETLGTGYAQNQPRVTVTGYSDRSDSP